jgi:hypothetical protein
MQSAIDDANISIRPHSSSNAGYFAEYNIPYIISSPPGGDRHSDNKSISIDGINIFTNFIQLFSKNCRCLILCLLIPESDSLACTIGE